MKRINCQVVVVGAGPAGLAAAAAAYDAGAEQVVLIERDKYLGGILQQCIHNGFGVSIFKEDLTGPEYAARYIEQIKSRNIRLMLDTMVIDLGENREIIAVSAEEGLTRLSPRSVVLTMGCRERTRGAIRLPGKRSAGIMTAGTAQRFINIEGKLPGRSFVVLGSGDIGMIMARRLHLEGCSVKAVIEFQNCVGGLSRNLVQCLRDFEIPLYLRHTVTDIHGSPRVSAVDICPLDRDGRPDTEMKSTIKCDTLLLSVGLIPENELSRKAGIDLDTSTRGPIVDADFQTSVPGVFAAGNVLQVYDLVDDVSRNAAAAGTAAAEFALAESHQPRNHIRVLLGKGLRSVVPQQVSTEAFKPITFQLRCTDTVRKGTLRLIDSEGTELYSKKISIARPPEMMSALVPAIDPIPSGDLSFQFKGE
jgi:NADPH-dependent 2,4-dienoyl-CoA reductase/sulfur reductase-like enzyme